MSKNSKNSKASRSNDLLIVDGRNLVWRTGDAFKTLSAEVEGEFVGTGVLHGFLSVLIRLHKAFGGRVYIAWEGETNFRKTLFPGYKQRDDTDEERAEIVRDLLAQEETLRDVLSLIGIRQYAGVDCEADDVIGTLAEKAKGHGLKVMIYSGDSDVRQLVDDLVWVASPMFKGGDKVFDAKAVKGKHGVEPDRIADLKALAGDSSDKIPGVRGVGPKRALALLEEHGSVEAIVGAYEKGELKATPKILEAFGNVDLRLFKTLTTILRDAKVKAFPVEKDHSELPATLMKYKLRTLLDPNNLRALKKLAA